MPSKAPISPTLSSLTTTAVVDLAWEWLCKRRRDYPDSADIWWLRGNWDNEKQSLRHLLKSGDYHFEPLLQVTRRDGEMIELWSARDSLALKALTIVLADAFEVSDRCTHIKGNGGSKGAVKQLAAALPDYRFVFRTDVKSFYASIDHWALYEQL
jgi:RNA-directed DNA polymerase